MSENPAYSAAAKAAELPDAQRIALQSLVQGRTRQEAAHDARVNVRTLSRWLQDPVFLAALHQARAETYLEVATRIQISGLKAVEALLRVLECDRPSAVVQAARVLLSEGQSVKEDSLFARATEAEAEVEAFFARQGQGGVAVSHVGSAPPVAPTSHPALGFRCESPGVGQSRTNQDSPTPQPSLGAAITGKNRKSVVIPYRLPPPKSSRTL